MAGRAFTRAEIQAMSQEEAAASIADINEWIAAGAVDGQAPPDIKRPDGHVFTKAEIDAMSPEAVAANTEAISRQLAAGGIA